MTTAYIRYSTDKQDETQQVQALKDWATPRGITIDVIEKDEGVSGSVSYKDRKLYKLVKKMGAGDILVVSEVSRLGRSMSDLTKLISDELKPRKVRLICIKMGLDIDCAHLTAIDEMLLMAFGFAAQVEREMTIQRTQSAIDARKAAIEKDGGFISNAGRYCTKLGREKGCDLSEAHYAAARSREKKADEWKNASPLYKWFARQVRRGRDLKDIVLDAQELYEDDPQTWCTRTGKPLYLSMAWIWSKEILPVI